MTWVIGTPTIFGYCLGLADIQVTITYPNGIKHYEDAIQKIFPVGKFVVAGFSGDVGVGFSLIEDLRNWAYLPQKGAAWIPPYLALKWHRRARWLFSQNNRDSKKSHQEVHLLLLGAHPRKENGISGMPRTFGCIMKSPEFEPEEIPIGKVNSIGSGNEIEHYKEGVRDLNSSDYNPLMQLEVGNQGGYASAITSVLTSNVQKEPHEGVSKHFHVCIVRKESILLGKADYSIFYQDGRKEEVKMPAEIARNWTEFQLIMKRRGIKIEGSVAIA